MTTTVGVGTRPAASDAANDATGDGGDASTGPVALARDSLLGRGNTVNGQVVNRAHWSYFFNSGGSPMEGNVWTESPAGTFRTSMPSFRFSPMDLYAMGLIPASEVPPTFLIADPTTSANVTRDSPPEYNGRSVIVRGRRVDVTISGSPPPSIGGFSIDMDSQTNFVAADITLTNLYVRANVNSVSGVSISCTIDITSNVVNIFGDYALSPQVGQPTFTRRPPRARAR